MKHKSLLLMALVLGLSLLLVVPASALFLPSNGQAATLVLGEPDFTTYFPQPPTTGMAGPLGVTVDPTTGKVFVADTYDNRVLRFANVSALSNGAAAEGVLGQPGFTSNSPRTARNGMVIPSGVAVDAKGRLWVADSGNNRILRFDNAAAKANGANADAVLGQPGFTTGDAATTRSGFHLPFGVAVDSGGRLWVADAGNYRVLRFDSAASKANGANADGVLGQPDFTSATLHTTQNGMGGPSGKAGPSGVAVDADGRLWVADSFNHRVLRFDNAAAKANGANADGVLGQPDFTSATAQTTQSGMYIPFGVTLDPNGRLYVSEQGNNRVLIFNAAASLSNGANASYVLGQTDFTSSVHDTTATTFTAYAEGAFFDPAAKVLWVVDYGNRVLMFGQPYATLHIMPVIGLVNYFLPPGVAPTGSISIQTADGSIRTFEVLLDTKILPARRSTDLRVGSFVTLLARIDPATGQLAADQIVLHPDSAGPGFPTPTFTPTIVSAPPTATATPAGVPTP